MNLQKPWTIDHQLWTFPPNTYLCLLNNHTHMYTTLKPVLEKELAEIEKAGLYKRERIITSPQGADITVQGGQHVINFCANNYLGLSSHPKVVQADKDALDSHGYGMCLVWFFCGLLV